MESCADGVRSEAGAWRSANYLSLSPLAEQRHRPDPSAAREASADGLAHIRRGVLALQFREVLGKCRREDEVRASMVGGETWRSAVAPSRGPAIMAMQLRDDGR
jgi:hypothetical protein